MATMNGNSCTYGSQIETRQQEYEREQCCSQLWSELSPAKLRISHIVVLKALVCKHWTWHEARRA